MTEDINQIHTKLNFYVPRLIKANKKVLTDIYIEKHDAFYEWSVGSIKGEDIRQAIIDCFDDKEDQVVRGLTESAVSKRRRTINVSEGTENSLAFMNLKFSVQEEAISISGADQKDNISSDVIDPEKFNHQNWLNIRRRFVEKMKQRDLKDPGQRSQIDSPKSREVGLIDNVADEETSDIDANLTSKFINSLEKRISEAISYESETLVLRVILEDPEKPTFEIAVFDMNIPSGEVDTIVKGIKAEIDNFLSIEYPDFTSKVEARNIDGDIIKYIWACITPGENFEKDLDELGDDLYLNL